MSSCARHSNRNSPLTIFPTSTTVLRTANAPKTAPDATELLVAQALVDLEAGELKADLRPLQISAAREVDVKGGKKAIVRFILRSILICLGCLSEWEELAERGRQRRALAERLALPVLATTELLEILKSIHAIMYQHPS